MTVVSVGEKAVIIKIFLSNFLNSAYQRIDDNADC
jgi:hypothetical protein